MEMGPKTGELATLLDEMVSILQSVGEDYWAKWLEKDLQRIRACDFRGVEHLIWAFGGMGGLFDLIIHPANGHNLDIRDVESINNRLIQLLDKASQLANAIRRDAEFMS